MVEQELSEEYKKQICECESCGYHPLKHLERCPYCNSEAFHRYKAKYNKKEDEGLVNDEDEI